MKSRFTSTRRTCALGAVMCAVTSALVISLSASPAAFAGSRADQPDPRGPHLRSACEAPGFTYKRLAGPNRYATSQAVMEEGAGAWGRFVVVASGENPFDALTATPLANALKAPLLLSPAAGLSAETRAALQTAKEHGANYAVLVGGLNALSPRVFNQIQEMGYPSLVRYFGDDRFDTSVTVAIKTAQIYQENGQEVKAVFFADGTSFADSLAAGPAAATRNGLLFLTNGPAMVWYVAEEAASYDRPMWAIGGNAAKASTSMGARPVVGADRFDTAAQVARTFFPSTTKWLVANGYTYPDALSGGALAANLRSPMLLTKHNGVPAPLLNYLRSTGRATDLFVLGGPGSVSSFTERRLCEALLLP